LAEALASMHGYLKWASCWFWHISINNPRRN